jgi:hypothetical protein
MVLLKHVFKFTVFYKLQLLFYFLSSQAILELNFVITNVVMRPIFSGSA